MRGAEGLRIVLRISSRQKRRDERLSRNSVNQAELMVLKTKRNRIEKSEAEILPVNAKGKGGGVNFIMQTFCPGLFLSVLPLPFSQGLFP